MARPRRSAAWRLRLERRTPWGSARRLAVVLLAMTAALSTMSAGAAAPAGGSRQTSAPGAISGRVVNGTTREPVAGATVILLTSPLPERGPRRVSSGDDGMFRHDNVPPGRYALHVVAADYLAGGSGRQSPWDWLTSFDLAAGQHLRDVIVQLWPAGTIAGTVRDERGEPLALVPVRPLKLDYMAGEPMWIDVARSQAPVVTDDRGTYRVGGLEPADYIMMAPAPPGSRRASPIHSLPHQIGFSGGAWTIRDAAVIALGPGERRDGVDLTVRLGEDAARFPVSGRLSAAPPGSGITVRLKPADRSVAAPGVEELVTHTDATARFGFAAVTMGRYELLAWRPPAIANEASLVGETTVDVRGPVADLTIPMRQSSRIVGRLVFDGDNPARVLDRLQVSVRPLPAGSLEHGGIPEARVADDGRFATVGLPPGRYGLVLNAPALQGWRQAFWEIDGHLLVGRPLELGRTDLEVAITLTNRFGEIRGVVRDAAGRARPDARVIIFPRDPDRRGHGLPGAPTCVDLARPEPDGRFSVQVVPRCDVLVAAVATLPRLWMAPDYLESLVPLATPANVPTEESRTIDLVVLP